MHIFILISAVKLSVSTCKQLLDVLLGKWARVLVHLQPSWILLGMTSSCSCAGLLNPPPDKETGFSTALNAGKVKLAQIAGDKGIVKAIYNNSNDSYTAYSEVAKRSDFSSSTTNLAKKLAPEAEEARSFFDKWQAAQS